MEIERKFLLEDSSLLKLLFEKNVTIYKTSIKQFYTEISKFSEIRYRKKDEIYYLTNKAGAGLVRDELEVVISKNEYKEAKNKRISHIISKDRYSFFLDELEYFLDVYHDFLSPLVTLEIEFKSVEDANEFKFDTIFENVVKKEITQDERYKNKNLSLYANPECEFECNKALIAIKKSPNLELKFPSYIDASDGFRLLFNQIYQKIKTLKQSYIDSPDAEVLHQLRVNLRKSRSLLKLARSLYDERVIAQILNGLKMVANRTNEKRDFDVFIQYLKDVENSSEILKSLEFVSQSKQGDVGEFLVSKEVEEFFLDYENFLSDDSGFYKKDSKVMKKFIAFIIRKEIIGLEKRFAKLDDERENEYFHATRIELKKLRYLFESFKTMFDIEAFDDGFARLKKMQVVFGELQDRDVWCDIIDMYDKGEMAHFMQAQKGEISVQMFKLRGQILDKKPKFIKQIRKISKILKAYY
ncbi:CHAD domain-containing protein [Campylobacter geochelonis]|uniref:CYTH and CHAD domain-containing protein n=1 Tax=Campylobacter geochelonis TaxID=1780362 RepID=UPI0007709B8B|nr:CHAD domain-containing protein [Campylobacter geochelonis]CZE46743.1 CHAD domain-contain protein [Campylobacter geochelonis]